MNQNWMIPSVVPRAPTWDMGVPDQPPQSPMQQPPMQPPQGILPQQPQGGGLLSGMGKPGGFMEKANNWMTPERALALQGIGMGLSQLAVGRPADLSPVHEALGKRQREKQMREAMEAPAIAEWFSPQERAVLALMPEHIALPIVAARFQQTPPSPQSPIGKIEADFRAGLIPEDVYMAEMERQAGSHGLITGEAAAAMGLDPNKAYNRGPDGRIYEIGGGGTTVNIGGSEVGQIPSGFELFTDPETGARSLRPIPGGPAEMALAEEARQRAIGSSVTSTAAQTVFEDTARALDVIDRLGALAAGAGSLLSVLPQTGARELRGHIDSVKGNIGIDQLLKIKQSGAGLGAIPQAQLEMLASLLGNLDAAQDPASLRYNLQRVQEIYSQIIEAEGGNPIEMYEQRQERFRGRETPAPSGPQPGDVMDGYRFKGGDPADQNSWELIG